MSSTFKINRRDSIKAGLASAAVSVTASTDVFAANSGSMKPKAPGEIKAVFLGGDFLHNFLAQEPALRTICENAGCKFYSTHDARYVTPEFISDADLLIIQRWNGGTPGWVQGPIFEEAPTNDNYMSEELEKAIVSNVKDRGMGFISLHCALWAIGRKNYLNLLGIKPIIHGPIQIVHYHNFNRDHIITKGMKEFDMPLDENFGVELIDKNAVKLYETTGFSDKRHDIGGWCIEQNKGRVAGFTAGHTYFPYQDKNYLSMVSRAVYWTLRKNIPADKN